jgi:hypothetical protein
MNELIPLRRPRPVRGSISQLPKFIAPRITMQALNYLKRSYPDYSQMKPEEMAREWDAYRCNLGHTQSRGRGLDHIRSPA